MKKKMTVLVLAVAFTVVSVAGASAFTCVVKSVDVEGKTATLECKEKYIKKFKKGKKVKVSIKKKLEGC